MIVGLLALVALQFLPLVPYLFVSSEFGDKIALWVLLAGIIWAFAICLKVMNILSRYDRLYKHVQRGVITEIDPEKTSVFVDGYTGANVRKQHWVSVSAVTWRDAEVGQILDLTTYRK
jgi:predicted permease